MATPSIKKDYADFREETNRLLSLVASTSGLAPNHRKVVAEATLLRLSILLENKLKALFCKICCGAGYLDGTTPTLHARQRSIRDAVIGMRTLNRPKPRFLVWNDGKEIRENIEHIVDNSDHCVNTMKIYGSFLTELRYIRNHIAHHNDGSRKNYRSIVKRYYGAYCNGVTCGTLLLSERVSKPSLVETHIVTSRIFIKELAKAPQ